MLHQLKNKKSYLILQKKELKIKLVNYYHKEKKLKGKNLKKQKTLTNKIKSKTNKKELDYKAFMKEKKSLWKSISTQERKITDLQAKREFLFFKKIKRTKRFNS